MAKVKGSENAVIAVHSSVGFRRDIARYEEWRERVFGQNPTHAAIPHEILRPYLDAMFHLNRTRAGLYNRTITVGKDSTFNVLSIDKSIIRDPSIEIRMEGQKW